MFSASIFSGPDKVLVLFSQQVLPLLQDFPALLQDHLGLALGRLLSAEPGAAGRGCAGSLFQVLLQCQESPSPCWDLLAEGLRAQAPILSVLAACCPVSLHFCLRNSKWGCCQCLGAAASAWGLLTALGLLCCLAPFTKPCPVVLQDANLISCLCVWIITSVDEATRAEVTSHTPSWPQSPQWDLQDLAVIWKVFLRKQKSKTLLRGFQLFLKVRELVSGLCLMSHLLGL